MYDVTAKQSYLRRGAHVGSSIALLSLSFLFSCMILRSATHADGWWALNQGAENIWTLIFLWLSHTDRLHHNVLQDEWWLRDRTGHEAQAQY